MPGRPPKPIHLIKTEGKTHLTKAQIEQREKAESALLTGVSLKPWSEVKADKVANKEFNRLRKLLKIIEKDDALHEGIINRYCVLHSECKQIEDTMKQLRQTLLELNTAKDNGDVEFSEYLDRQSDIQSSLLKWDKSTMSKRAMLLQIERESIMTILSALRSIPKQEPEKEDSPMAEYLKKKQQAR